MFTDGDVHMFDRDVSHWYWHYIFYMDGYSICGNTDCFVIIEVIDY